jgi:hypothetical protein
MKELVSLLLQQHLRSRALRTWSLLLVLLSGLGGAAAQIVPDSELVDAKFESRERAAAMARLADAMAKREAPWAARKMKPGRALPRAFVLSFVPEQVRVQQVLRATHDRNDHRSRG